MKGDGAFLPDLKDGVSSAKNLMKNLRLIVGIIFLVESLGVAVLISYYKLDVGAGVACWVSGALGVALFIMTLVADSKLQAKSSIYYKN